MNHFGNNDGAAISFQDPGFIQADTSIPGRCTAQAEKNQQAEVCREGRLRFLAVPIAAGSGDVDYQCGS